MAAIKEMADSSICETVNKVIDAYHQELKHAGVQVTVLAVKSITENGEILPDEQALTSNGHMVPATVRRASCSETALGAGDVIIEVDSYMWQKQLGKQSRIALIDHELCHVCVCRDNRGSFQHNFNGRPHLELIHHDIDIGLFYDVVRRHGAESIEAMISTSMFAGVDRAMEVFESNNRLKSDS